MTEPADAGLANLRKALLAGDLRIEFGVAFSMIEGAMASARIFERNPDTGRWRKADVPLLVPPKGGGRVDLLKMLAVTLEEAIKDEQRERTKCHACSMPLFECVDLGEGQCCDGCNHEEREPDG